MTGRRYAALILLVAGCGTPSQQSVPAVNLSGYPLEFRQGYADGCASAKPNAARMRDEARFKSDANYAQGWRDGNDMCGKR